MKNLLCKIALHKWLYDGDPNVFGTKRACQIEGCDKVEVYIVVAEPEAFMTPGEWVDYDDHIRQ